MPNRQNLTRARPLWGVFVLLGLDGFAGTSWTALALRRIAARRAAACFELLFLVPPDGLDDHQAIAAVQERLIDSVVKTLVKVRKTTPR